MSFNIFDHYRLNSIEKSVDRIHRASSIPNPYAPKQADVEELQAEVSRQRLLLAVLFRLLLDKKVASESEINALLSEVDAADGKRDGGFAGDPVTGAVFAATEPPDDENSLPKIRT